LRPPPPRFADLFSRRPVILAPMEDVTDAVFRRLCRGVGAELCLTEFVNVEGLLRGCRNARRKANLAPDDHPTAIQIYGSDPDRLVEAAQVAEDAGPVFIDINCGCWVPKIAGRGAGAGWLRDPSAMVEMAARVVGAVRLPVTVKTRVGWGPESHMPIVDLAPRLEDAGVAALTVHCRTAQVGHSGPADWTWAERAAARVKIPVIVNGDVRGAADAKRALEQTGCAGVMVGRRAIDHPWVFREIRALLDTGTEIDPPTAAERILFCRAHLEANVAARGEHFGVRVTRRHLTGYLKGLPGAGALRKRLLVEDSLARCLEILSDYLDAASSQVQSEGASPAAAPPAPPAPVSQMQSPSLY
jgi:tRNA-dihydrouridine synthase B